MSTATRSELEARARAAAAAVEDPEFPRVTVEHLGMLQAVRVDEGAGEVEVDLLPTFLGCPALDVIAADVRAALTGLSGVRRVQVAFVSEPVWTPQRITPEGRRRLAAEFTVAVPGSLGAPPCPVCGSGAVEPRSPFGPTACRAIAYCPDCRNPVEVIRR